MKDTDQEVQTILDKPIKSLQGKDFLSVSNAAKLLSTSTKMIYRMIADGKLAAVNLSVRKTVISRKEIDRLFEIKEQIRFPKEKLVVRPKIRDSYTMAEAQISNDNRPLVFIIPPKVGKNQFHRNIYLMNKILIM